MVKKIMAGLAISVGAGLALTTVATRAKKKKDGGWHTATPDGTMKLVTLRPGVPRNEQTRTEPDEALTTAPERSAELAELRVMIEALDQRNTEMMSTVNQRIDELQNQLPRFIDVKVASRLREAEERLRTEFQDEQSRTLDAFLQTLDQKVLPRISQVEEGVGAQGEEIGRMRQRIGKTDAGSDGILNRIEKVADSVAAPSSATYTNSHVMEINQKAVA